MEQLLIDMYEIATIALPACAACLVAWLYGSRQSGRAWVLLVIVWVIYLYGLLHFTGAGTIFDGLRHGFTIRPEKVNLIPFSDTEPMMALNVLNVILFVPLGILAPLLLPKKVSWWQVALLGLAVSLAIELTQLVNMRITDVDDLIMNTLGALVGYVAYCLLPARWRRAARRQAVGGVVAGCLVVAFAGRFLFFNEMGMAGLLYGF